MLALLPALLSQGAAAASAYVSDELILGVYPDQNGQGQRLATLHSGAAVETLGASGEYTHVKLTDGTQGWVKSTYLTAAVPAVVRVKQLEEDMERNRAATPVLAEAAARSQVLELENRLKAAQSELAARPTGSPAAAQPREHVRIAGWTLSLSVLTAAAGGIVLGELRFHVVVTVAPRVELVHDPRRQPGG